MTNNDNPKILSDNKWVIGVINEERRVEKNIRYM